MIALKIISAFVVAILIVLILYGQLVMMDECKKHRDEISLSDHKGENDGKTNGRDG